MWLSVALVTFSRAHDPSADAALQPFVHAGELLGAWTTAGLVRWDGAVWLEVCGATLPGVTDVWLAPDGRFLAVADAGLEESLDGGCSFSPRPDMPNAIGLTQLGDTLAATTTDPLVGVALSDDDGVTFNATGPFPLELTVESIGHDAAGTLWVTAASATGPAVVVSTNHGETWDEVQGPPDPIAVSFRTHGLGPSGGVLVTGASLLASTSVWESGPAGWIARASLPLDVSSVACLGETCLASLSGIALLRWDAAVGTSSATLLPEGSPVGCLVPDDDGRVWGCHAAGEVTLFAVTADGFAFDLELPGEFIAPRSCPTGSPGAAECIVEAPPPIGGGGGTDEPGEVPPLEVSGGCCDSKGTTPAVAVLPLLLVGAKLRRTRRSLAQPRTDP